MSSLELLYSVVFCMRVRAVHAFNATESMCTILLQALQGDEGTSDEEDTQRRTGPTYVEEQEQYRRAFLQARNCTQHCCLVKAPHPLSCPCLRMSCHM